MLASERKDLNMTIYVITPADPRTNRMTATSYTDVETAKRAATVSDYVISDESDVLWTGQLLVDVFNALTDSGVKKFESRAIGVRRLMSILPQVAAAAKETKVEDTDMHEAEAEAEAEAVKRKPRTVKLGKFAPVRAGTMLAKTIDVIAMGGTVKDIMAEIDADEKKVRQILRHGLGTMHGIGYDEADDGVLSIKLPEGVNSADDLIKTNGTGESRRSRHVELDEHAAAGNMPGHLVITSEANKHRQKAVDRLEKLVADGDWEGVEKFNMNGIDTYSKMINRHRDRFLAAHRAQ